MFIMTVFTPGSIISLRSSAVGCLIVLRLFATVSVTVYPVIILIKFFQLLKYLLNMLIRKQTKFENGLSGVRMSRILYGVRLRLTWSMSVLSAYMTVYSRLRPSSLAERIWKVSLPLRLGFVKMIYVVLRQRRGGYTISMPKASNITYDEFIAKKENLLINRLYGTSK